MLSRFLSQPSVDYRNFQIVYGLLAAHFIVPALGYLIHPDAAVNAFVKLGGWLGGEYYPLYEVSYLWRILAGTNVLCLGFMCVMLQLDIKRHWPVLYPLVFMKGATAAIYALVYVFSLRYPAFLAITLWDGLNCVFFVYYGLSARRAAEADESVLVPRPLGFTAPAVSRPAS